MGLEDIGEIISKVSPWVALGCLSAWCFAKYLDHRKSIREGSDILGYTRGLATLTREIQGVGVNQLQTHSLLTQHAETDHNDQNATQGILKELVGITRTQAIGQQQLLKEIVRMNASLAGDKEVSTENAKLLIEQQWAWCRSETQRIVVNSVTNNNFVGDEERVTRSVQRAWRFAGNQSKESLTKFGGLNYPFTRLFEESLPLVWERVWKLAVPLYHRHHADHTSKAFLEDIGELAAQVKEWFDTSLDEHFRAVEDIDTGEIYPRGTDEEHGGGDAGTTEYMSRMLKAYKPGGKGIPSEHLDLRTELRSRYSLTPRQLPIVKPPKPPGHP